MPQEALISRWRLISVVGSADEAAWAAELGLLPGDNADEANQKIFSQN